MSFPGASIAPSVFAESISDVRFTVLPVLKPIQFPDKSELCGSRFMPQRWNISKLEAIRALTCGLGAMRYVSWCSGGHSVQHPPEIRRESPDDVGHQRQYQHEAYDSSHSQFLLDWPFSGFQIKSAPGRQNNPGSSGW
jgi:hypothetical protein